MSRRAESLAARIEGGGQGLASFVEKLSDAEWRKPMVTGSDRRTVGVGPPRRLRLSDESIARATPAEGGRCDLGRLPS